MPNATRGQKFAPKDDTRLREHMQWIFAQGIQVAARLWELDGKPESEWSELYEHVIEARGHGY